MYDRKKFSTFSTDDYSSHEPEFEQETPQNDILMHINLDNFKTHSCKNNLPHNHKFCPDYHSINDKRRRGYNYSYDICKKIKKKKECFKRENCNFAHNKVEQLYHPEYYKTKFCTKYPDQISMCEYGQFCSFAHSEEDINIELIHNYVFDDDFYMFHYKTVWCPFNLTYHDKALCVYAHNWQDFRRSPKDYYYEPKACPNWKSKDFILNYEEGCYNSMGCRFCHGWKELEYHPKIFKTKSCPNKKCDSHNCPYFHKEREPRSLLSHSNLSQKSTSSVRSNNSDKSSPKRRKLNDFWIYYPRNRITRGTFKEKQTKSQEEKSQSQMSFKSDKIPQNPQLLSVGSFAKKLPHRRKSENIANNVLESLRERHNVSDYVSIDYGNSGLTVAKPSKGQRRGTIDLVPVHKLKIPEVMNEEEASDKESVASEVSRDDSSCDSE